MTNKEKYGDMLMELSVNSRTYALRNGIPTLCSGNIECEECDFCDKYSGDCKENGSAFREWLNSEYKEPPVDWSKVAVDTTILVRNEESDEWKKRHFAKYENGLMYTWTCGKTSWSVGNECSLTPWKYAKLAESEG